MVKTTPLTQAVDSLHNEVRTVFGTKAVTWRGTVRENVVLFVGEAPGPLEEKAGEPFIGPAGVLMQRWLSEHLGLLPDEWLLTNSVFVMPRQAERPDRFRAPTEEEMAACRPYLRRLIDAIQPRPIVAVGRCAEKTLIAMGEKPLFLYHPQYFRYGGLDWIPFVKSVARQMRDVRCPPPLTQQSLPP